jgi:2-keto-4-pentenoate hydratase/2-oxohepta-3-ene-1,7-dioic acid hydratase in catechol pathway
MPRYVYYTLEGKVRWGRVTEAAEVVPLSGSIFDLPTGLRDDGDPVPLARLRPGPPVRPGKLVCIGRNYRAHARELNHEVPAEPLLFLKPPSAVIAHGEAIVFPTGQSELVHHEGELAVVIGRRGRHVPAARAHEHVLGYTLMNDVTARDLQRKDVQFTRGKGFDTFAPLGPWLDTDFAPAAQRLTVTVDGALRQDGRLDAMVFPVPELIEYISRVMTLEPGDVIATGTPAGVGPLRPGDRVSVTLEGLGTLTNPVVAEA